MPWQKGRAPRREDCPRCTKNPSKPSPIPPTFHKPAPKLSRMRSALRSSSAAGSISFMCDTRAAKRGRPFPACGRCWPAGDFSEEDATHAEVEKNLGIGIWKIAIEHAHPLQGVAEFLISHRPDLVVMATHGAQGWSRWLSEFVSEGIAAKTHIPALFIGPKARSFVDPKTGRMHLKSALIPVARKPAPQRALLRWRDMCKSLAVSERFVHAGDPPFELATAEGEKLKVHILQGPVVEFILAEASSSLADLLVMPTAGHNGFLDGAQRKHHAAGRASRFLSGARAAGLRPDDERAARPARPRRRAS